MNAALGGVGASVGPPFRPSASTPALPTAPPSGCIHHVRQLRRLTLTISYSTVYISNANQRFGVIVVKELMKSEIFHIKIFLPENHFSGKTHSVRLLQENGSGKKSSKKKTFKQIGIYLKKMKAFFVILVRSDVILGSDSSWDVRGLQKTTLKF